MASATEEEEFTADDVFGMLVESSNVIKVAYTQDAEGTITVVGDQAEIVKTAGERDATVASMLEREDMERQNSARGEKPAAPLPVAELASAASVTDAALFELAGRLTDGVRAADVRTARLFKDAVVAHYLVDWLVQNAGKPKDGGPALVVPRPVATELAGRMAASGWLVPAGDDAPGKTAPAFTDGNTVLQYLANALQDDACPEAVLRRLHDGLAAEAGGVTTHTEKIMLKSVRGVVHEADLTAWLQRQVPGFKPASTAAIVRVLLKRGVLEPVRMIGAVMTSGAYVVAARKQLG